MSFLYLPRELIKYIFEHLNDEDYVSTQLTCKHFTTIFSDIEKKAMWDVETAVKYKQDRHLSKFDIFDVECYAYIYNRLELRLYLTSENYTNIRLGNIDKIDWHEGIDNILELACQYNVREVVDVALSKIEHFLNKYIEIAASHNHLDLAEYLLQCNRGRVFITKVCMRLSEVCTYESFEWIYARYEHVDIDDQCILKLDPRITEEIKVEIKANLEKKFNDCSADLKFNHNSVRNVEILQLSNFYIKKLLRNAIYKDYLPLCKWLIKTYNFEVKIENPFKKCDKYFFFSIEHNLAIGNEKEIAEKVNHMFSYNSDLLIRLFNRFPQLQPYFNDNETLINMARDRDCDVYCFNVIYNLASRTPEDILSCLKSCKDEKKKEYLLEEFKRKSQNKLRLLLEVGEGGSDIEKRQLLYSYFDTFSINDLLAYLRIIKNTTTN